MSRYHSRARHVALFIITALAASVVGAHSYQLQALRIDHPFARATPPGATTGGAFLTIHNAGTSGDKLLSVKSAVAGAVQIHTMSMDGNVMRMREISVLDVPAGATVVLKPGGYHLMLVDLRQPLQAGARVPLTLTFERAGSIDVDADVEAMGAGHPQH